MIKVSNIKIVAAITMVIVSLIICFSASFFLTSHLYENIGRQPPELLVQLINFILGLFFELLIIIYARKKLFKNLVGVLEATIKVIGEIAKGNFNVRLDCNVKADGQYEVLVKSVNNMAEELSNMEKMRQEFISNVSHEIQSPLTSIRGFAQALKNKELNAADKSHYLSIIESESMRLSRLSDNLLKLASLEAETMKFAPKTYRLDKQLRNLILACEPQWLDKGIEMEVILDEINIHADEDLLSQVWINLLHNSIKFTPENGAVRIELHPKADKIEFKISDTGIGISEEDQTHIFERFYKADKSRDYSKKGSGLGLSIAMKIVELHNGTIGVAGSPGKGTTFTVSLPLQQ